MSFYLKFIPLLTTLILSQYSILTGDFARDIELIKYLPHNPRKIKTLYPNITIVPDKTLSLKAKKYLKKLIALHKAESIEIVIFTGEGWGYYIDDKIYLHKDILNTKYLAPVAAHEFGHLYGNYAPTRKDDELLADKIATLSLVSIYGSAKTLIELMNKFENKAETEEYPSVAERIKHVKELSRHYERKRIGK